MNTESNIASNAYQFIIDSLNAGKTVYLSTYTRTTRVTPSNYKKWMTNGWEMFKINSAGTLLMASGSTWNIVATKDIVSMKIEVA